MNGVSGELDVVSGLPVIRYCDQIDGFVRGVQAMAQIAKDMRMREALAAKAAPATPPAAPSIAVDPEA